MDAAWPRSILDPATTAERLDRAIDDFDHTPALAAELGLREAKTISRSVHPLVRATSPYRKETALAHLRDELKDAQLARERLSLALRLILSLSRSPRKVSYAAVSSLADWTMTI